MTFSLDSAVFYLTCTALAIEMYFFCINFMNYFQFHPHCPIIRKDTDVDGIYPMLIELHTFLTIFATSLILSIVSWTDFINNNNDYTIAIHLVSIDSNVFDTHPLINSMIAWLVFLLFVLETYFSFSRYYRVVNIAKSNFFSIKAHIPFFIYVVTLFILECVSLTILPIVTFLIMPAHIIINVYLGYYFYESVRQSYELVFKYECMQIISYL